MSTAKYSLYIIRCADGSLYTGIATDVARRFKEHKAGPRGAKYLRGRGPLKLAFELPVGDRSAASRAEYQVKNLPKSDKELLIAGRKSLAELGAELNFAQASGAAGG
ncbi:MAG: GIY-YIG nuclease family protein [Woeseiaceae bacterium]